MNLAGATLHRINLIGADLNGATLAGAELHGANLTNAQCVGTDFTGAHLTGACLEAWNIDETTILKDIDCQYVFLKAEPDAQGNRERRPHNPDKIFQPGDFEKFFKEMLDTVQILIRQGIHPQVFRDTLAQLMADYHLPDDAVQGYERKGEDMLVTVAVPPGTNKGKFEQDFDELQALKLEAARARGLLEGERKRADDLKAIMLSLGPAASNVTVTTTAMTHSNNPNISAADGSFVNTGNNLQGNVINLGEISGQVSLHYGQDADKILQTLESLQSYAQTFPETEKEAVQVHLEDLTHDLQQFKKPSPARLKTRLMGLLRIAVALGTGIATATDFANNVLELADKLAVPIEVLEPQLREFKAIHPNFDWQPPDNSELEHK
ncbi:pentapeptide repeat-containing protein [Leptolyngbya iicbica]|uniref:pentapeptide repeat-containing protein n=1 Tax=Leptolyngbya iicbica TaxID=3161580 RepID=UPI00068A334F|nr:pentapeptide repeat-containing protein [Leptolyngbya sp. LK]